MPAGSDRLRERQNHDYQEHDRENHHRPRPTAPLLRVNLGEDSKYHQANQNTRELLSGYMGLSMVNHFGHRVTVTSHDPETFETVTLTAELVGDARNYLVENQPVTVTFVEDKAVSIDLPSSVVLGVKDAPAVNYTEH